MSAFKFFSVCVIAAAGFGATADIIILVNGGVLEGKVRYEGDKVIIEQEAGRITLSADSVDHIEKKDTNIDLFEKKLAEASQKKDATASDYVAVTQFAAERGLQSRAQVASSAKR